MTGLKCLKAVFIWHSLKSGPETRDTGPWDMRPWNWDPGTWDWQSWDMGPWKWDPGTLRLATDSHHRSY